MRISDWSSDVCSSDLKLSNSTRYGKTDLIFKSHNVIGRVTHPWCPALGLLQAVISHLISSAREFTIEASGMRGFVINSSAHILCHRSEEHTSELQSLMRISYAVFCLKKKKQIITESIYTNYNKNND